MNMNYEFQLNCGRKLLQFEKKPLQGIVVLVRDKTDRGKN